MVMGEWPEERAMPEADGTSQVAGGGGAKDRSGLNDGLRGGCNRCGRSDLSYLGGWLGGLFFGSRLTGFIGAITILSTMLLGTAI